MEDVEAAVPSVLLRFPSGPESPAPLPGVTAAPERVAPLESLFVEEAVGVDDPGVAFELAGAAFRAALEVVLVVVVVEAGVVTVGV